MKKMFLVSLVLISAVIIFGLYQYFRPPRNLKNVEPQISIAPSELKKQLAGDIRMMHKFGDSVIVIEGQISSIEKGHTTTVLVDSVVRCELDKSSNVILREGNIRIKGILGGYDDLFEQVLLVKCEIDQSGQSGRVKRN